MEIRQMEPKYVKEALELALEEYRAECRVNPQLIQDDFEAVLSESLNALFQKKYGKVALEDGHLTGYLVFEGPWDGFFGNVKGVFSPLGGSAFAGRDRNRLASMLFEAVAADLAEDGVFSLGVCSYAHDEEAGNAFVMNGFGIPAGDAILDLNGECTAASGEGGFLIEELFGEEKKQIWDLKLGLIEHMASSPIFFPTPPAHMGKWFDREDIRIFAAKDGARAIGRMAVTGDGETYISEHAKVDNICMAYVEEAYRKSGVAQQLLAHVLQVSQASGMTHLGVDYETMNPTALRFWTKHFKPYTYSYVRRLDERVLGYQADLNKWKKNKGKK